MIFEKKKLFWRSIRYILEPWPDWEALKKKYSAIFILSYDKKELAGFSVKEKQTPVIYLDKSLEEIFHDFNDTTRNEIRKTLDDKIKDLRFVSDDSDLAANYRLSRDFEKSQGRRPDPISQYRGCKIFSAYYRDELISSVICFDADRVLRAKAICSRRLTVEDKEKYKIISHATRRLIYEICRFGWENGYELVDLGSVNFNKPNLAKFKMSFTSDLKPEHTYTWKSRQFLIYERMTKFFKKIKSLPIKLLNIRKKKFVKDAAVLQVGSFFSTGLSFLASIVYARILGIDGYADYSLIFIFVGVISIFMDWGTNQTTIMFLAEAYAQGDRKKFLDVLSYYIKLTLAISLVVGVAIVAVSPLLTGRFYNSREIGNLARVIILSDVLKVFFGMYTIVLQAVRRIKKLTVVENINKIFYVAIPATLVIFGFGLRGLVWGHLLNAAIFAVFAWVAYARLCRQDNFLPAWRKIISNRVEIKRFIYFFKFGFLIAVDKNLGSLYSTLPLFFLGMFNKEAVAWVKIAIAYAGLPLMLIGPISRLLMVQLPKSKVYSLAILKRDFIRSALGSVAICFVVAVMLMPLAQFLVPLVYGQEYLPAVNFSYLFLVASIVTALGVGSGSLFRVLHLMKKSIAINIALLAAGSAITIYFLIELPLSLSICAVALWLPLATLVVFTYLTRKLNKMIKAGQEEVIH